MFCLCSVPSRFFVPLFRLHRFVGCIFNGCRFLVRHGLGLDAANIIIILLFRTLSAQKKRENRKMSIYNGGQKSNAPLPSVLCPHPDSILR